MNNRRNAPARLPLRGRGQIPRRRTSRTLCAFLLTTLLIDTAWALDPHRLISQYAHTVWRVQDGFPHNPISVTQTSDGYVWIAATGLVRFDGVRMIPFPPQKSLPTDVGISALLGSRDGSLWMATYQGLSRLKDGKAFSFPIKNGAVQSILEDHTGTIWITRSNTKDEPALCQIVGDDLECHGNKSDGNPAGFATALAEDKSGDIWFGCQMLCRWSRGSISHYMQEQMDHPTGGGVSALAVGATGSIWAAMDGVGPGAGVRNYTDGTFKSYVVPGFDGATILATALVLDRHQTLWVGTSSLGLHHIHDGHADHYGAAQGLSGDQVSSIYEDREGNLWITTDKGVDLFRDVPIVSYTSTEGLSGNATGAVIARNDSSVLMGTEEALNIIRSDSVSLIRTAHGHPIQYVTAMLEDHAGQVWVGVNRTLMIYQREQFAEIKGQDGRPLEDIGNIIFSLAEDIDGNIWAIAYDQPKHILRLLRITDRRVQEDIQIASLVPRSHFLAADPAGGIWIGTVDGKLAHYFNGTAKIVSTGPGGAAPVLMGGFSVDADGVV